MTDDLNGLDLKINDRGFFERILKEFKETLEERDQRIAEVTAERNLRLDERFSAQEKAIDKAEQRLDGTLQGFPQEYARRLELEQMITALGETSTLLAQKVVDSAKALAEAQQKADDRVDARMKKMEEYQARLTGVAITFPIISGIVVFLLTLKT